MVKIRFDYEYICGGHVYERTIELDKSEFEEDVLLMLVCAYMQSSPGYPGREIDEYLHNKFPNVHKSDDMLSGGGCYNVYNCTVDGLKSFSRIVNGLLGFGCMEGEKYMLNLCKEYNKEHKEKPKENFSIWEN